MSKDTQEFRIEFTDGRQLLFTLPDGPDSEARRVWDEIDPGEAVTIDAFCVSAKEHIKFSCREVWLASAK